MANRRKKQPVNCTDCETNQCFIRQHCQPSWLGIINFSKNLVWYNKGQHIFREGDRVFGLYFILSGKVKVISSGINSREQIVRFAREGQVLGHRGYGNEVYPVGAVALEDTGVCFIDNATLQDAFINNPKFTYELMQYYSKELRKIEIRLRYLAQMSLREKVAECLLCLLDTFGVEETDDSLSVVLSRQELADFAGTTAEQITRSLSEFEAEHLIAKDGKKIILLNCNGLRAIVFPHSKSHPFST